MSENSSVPSSWVRAPLKELTSKLVDGSHNPPRKENTGLPMLSAVNIQNNSIQFSTFRWITEESFEVEDARTRITEDDILLTIVGAIGRAAVVPKGIEKFTLQRSVAVITPVGVDSQFLMHQLESPRISLFFQENARGTAQKGVYLKTLGTTEIYLPPLNEQRRIAAKIEELFSELDKGIESLKTVREQLKVYRQALHKHAFEGKLTEKWRKENQNELEPADLLLARIKEEREASYLKQLHDWDVSVNDWEVEGKPGRKPVKPRQQKDVVPATNEELSAFPKLPVGWEWVKLGELAWSVKDGPHYTPKYSETGIPFISGGNIRPNGIDFSSVKYISENLHRELSARCKPALGDVLYTKGGTTGIARVNTYDFEFNVWVHVAVLKITGSLQPFYLQHVLNSPDCYAQSQRYTHGVGNQDLGLTRMIDIILPLCCEAEQTQMVSALEQSELEFDEIEGAIENEITRSEQLRQSILQQAFSGQLVPQDPTDEPASVLLERIKAEIDEGRQAAKRKPAKAKAKAKTKSKGKKSMADLLAVLKEQRDWISASETFTKLGIGDGSETDEIEPLYTELRQHVLSGHIKVERRQNEDWLRLSEARAS